MPIHGFDMFRAHPEQCGRYEYPESGEGVQQRKGVNVETVLSTDVSTPLSRSSRVPSTTQGMNEILDSIVDRGSEIRRKKIWSAVCPYSSVAVTSAPWLISRRRSATVCSPLTPDLAASIAGFPPFAWVEFQVPPSLRIFARYPLFQ